MTSLRGHKRREFPQSVRKAAFVRCCRNAPEGVVNILGVPQCESCGNVLSSGNIEYEHLDPDGLGGDPTLENCGVWCAVPCSSKKTHTEDNPRMRKADAVAKKAYGLQPVRRKKIVSRGFTKMPRRNEASRPVEKWRGY